MSAELLLSAFERVAEAPGASTRLRRFVLDMAVRGLLVEQDPGDSHASLILEQATVPQLDRSRPAALSREFPELGEVPYEVPDGWVWCRLNQVGLIIGGGTPPSGESDNFTAGGSGIAWLTPADMARQPGLEVRHGARDLTEKGLRSSSATLMPKGTVLFTSRAPIGYVGVAAQDITTNQGFKSLVPSNAVDPRYGAIFFRAFAPAIDAAAPGTTFKEVSGKIVSRLPFPLPPLPEQRRIVTRVNDLMLLCDQLEEAQKDRESRRDAVRSVSLRRLIATKAEGRTQDDVSFFLDASPRFVTKPGHVQAIREVILDLAVQGRLVSQSDQDPQDDHVRNVRHSPNPPEVAPMDGEFPSGWGRATIEELSSMVTSGSRGWAEYYSSSGSAFIRAQNIRFGLLKLDDLAHVTLPERHEGKRTRATRGDILVVITGAGVTNPALVDVDIEDAYVSQHVGLVKLHTKEVAPWVLLCLMARRGCRDDLLSRAYGSGKPGLNLDNLRTLMLPIPPIAEQRRIAAKVRELMLICDELEAALGSKESEGEGFLDALLHERPERQGKSVGTDSGVSNT